jgi:hypothetical protein
MTICTSISPQTSGREKKEIVTINFSVCAIQQARGSLTNNNNNNQAFYSQASWGSQELKPHEPKNRDKTRVKKKGGNKWR